MDWRSTGQSRAANLHLTGLSGHGAARRMRSTYLRRDVIAPSLGQGSGDRLKAHRGGYRRRLAWR
jgi:hypothetical protein